MGAIDWYLKFENELTSNLLQGQPRRACAVTARSLAPLLTMPRPFSQSALLAAGTAGGARVVVLSSSSQNASFCPDDCFPSEQACAAGVEWSQLPPASLRDAPPSKKLYEFAKLCNVLYASHLARRLGPASGVLVGAVHPGNAIATNLAANDPAGGPCASCLMAMLAPFGKSLSQGASTSLHVLLAPAAALTPGGYFVDCGDITAARRNPIANSEIRCAFLFDWTARAIEMALTKDR